MRKRIILSKGNSFRIAHLMNHVAKRLEIKIKEYLCKFFRKPKI